MNIIVKNAARCSYAKSWFDGIKKNLMPPAPVEEDVYHFDDTKLKERNIDTLPYSLWQALKELNEDKLIQDALGKHVYERYIDAKTREWDEFRLHVTDWELDKYLEIY